MTTASSVARIRYPDRYRPDRTWVFVSNELDVTAPCDRVWAWLVRAESWPDWYPNSRDVKLASSGRNDLSLGTRFTWQTFGVRLRSEVVECVPGERIAWTAKAFGVDAYHAWLLTPTASGCHVLTEETQHGWLAFLSHLFRPHRMYRGHQLWLERLRLQATTRDPLRP